MGEWIFKNEFNMPNDNELITKPLLYKLELCGEVISLKGQTKEIKESKH